MHGNYMEFSKEGKRNSGSHRLMRMPSAKFPVASESDVGELAKKKEVTGLMGRVRRTLKRNSKPTKEESSRDVGVFYQRGSFDGVTYQPSRGDGMEMNSDHHQGELDNDRKRVSQNGDAGHAGHGMCEHTRCDAMNGNGVHGMERYGRPLQETNGIQYGSDHGMGRGMVNGRVQQNGGHSPMLDRGNGQVGNLTCCHGGNEFERQGARPKTGLYRKKSSPINKNSDVGLSTVVLNVQANRDGVKGKNVIADVQLTVGSSMDDDEESDSAYNVPLQRKASVRNDISVKVYPGVGLDSNSDVTVNCSVNVHCHIAGNDRDTDSLNGCKPNDGDYVNNPQSKVMSSAELEPLVIQMTPHPDAELPNHPRTPHIAEVMMRDSLTHMDNETFDRPPDSLSKDMMGSSRIHHVDTNADMDRIIKEKLKREHFQEILLPKDSQIIDVVTTPKDSVCHEADVHFEYGLPRSVSDGAAILASYRHDESYKDRSMYGPAIDRRTKPKPTYGDYAQPEGLCSPEDDEDLPPPIPPRISMVLDQETKKEDWETEPTHMCLPALVNGLYRDTESSASLRSKSLPRHSSLNDISDPSVPRRSKTSHIKNRMSQLFKTPRRKSCAFPDRPLPDVPANKVGSRDNRRGQIQRPQSLYCPTETRSPIIPPPPARPCPQRPTPTTRLPPPRPGQENMVVIERSEGFPTKEELARCRGEFASSLRRISECGWYWGPMSWDDAEMRLENTPDGSFLVRDSSDDRHILSLTFRVQGSTHHTRIEHHNGKFSFWSQPTTHGSSSIVEFIEEAMRHSRNGRFLYFLRPRWPGLPPVPLQLLYPISRFQKARSLQHMCRFVIRRHVRLDHIDALPLPRRLKEYLREGQYYTPDDIKP